MGLLVFFPPKIGTIWSFYCKAFPHVDMELLNIHNIRRKLLNRAVKCYLFQYEKRYFRIIGLSFSFSICCKISLTVISVFLKTI